MMTPCGLHCPEQWQHVLAPVYGGLEEPRSPVSSGPPERDVTVLADIWHVERVRTEKLWRSKLQRLRNNWYKM